MKPSYSGNGIGISICVALAALACYIGTGIKPSAPPQEPQAIPAAATAQAREPEAHAEPAIGESDHERSESTLESELGEKVSQYTTWRVEDFSSAQAGVRSRLIWARDYLVTADVLGVLYKNPDGLSEAALSDWFKGRDGERSIPRLNILTSYGNIQIAVSSPKDSFRYDFQQIAYCEVAFVPKDGSSPKRMRLMAFDTDRGMITFQANEAMQIIDAMAISEIVSFSIPSNNSDRESTFVFSTRDFDTAPIANF
ncbi:hypothetical protein HOV04_gp34 [Xanthomonas phage XcP1]|uniref:Uncharacterized protein n=1 Tax=Xanthomonas phage XcP1 TaxID=2785027 RepID=A0A3S7L8H6_9CAUD|nr:hypothetical protein HOV04_gp34 [Xanthomonas phage XcP1]AWN08536.1 hypothetical protein XcP1_034 [Xanthomonas phage XcP1]